MSKTRVTATIIFAASIALVLAGCGGATQAGSAVATSTAAAPVTVTTTAAAKPKPSPTPTVTATVTQAQPPVVVVPAPAPAPAVTVYQQPTTVYQQAPTVYPGTSSADQQVSTDYSTAESVVGWWIPQLSSNTDSASAMAKFRSLQGMSGGYTDVFMVSSNSYSSFRYSGYYVTLIPRTFSTAAGANAWCDSEGFATDNCLAKRLSHIDGPDGNTVER